MADGKLALDSARAVVGGIDIEAHGSLAINEADPLDEVELAFQTDSLDLLRQLFTGDDVVARPTLDPLGLEAEVLRLEGIDPDTLPLPENVRVAGRVQGSATLRGSLRNFAARGSARFEGLRYGTDVARSGGCRLLCRCPSGPGGGIRGPFRGRLDPGPGAVLQECGGGPLLPAYGRSRRALSVTQRQRGISGQNGLPIGLPGSARRPGRAFPPLRFPYVGR